MAEPEHLQIERVGPVVHVWLNRPEVRNAFNPQLIAELTAVFNSLGAEDGTRAVALGGRGKVFCAGADLTWMREMAGYTREENLADARRLADMLAALDGCACPLVGRVQRGAMGGALGLMACCDSVICTDDALFAFSEVRLGISPATIAPYVISKVGAAHARDLFLSGERFSAGRALSTGLVHRVVPVDELDAAVEEKLGELLQAGPHAAAATKALIRDVAPALTPHLREQTAQLIAELRASAEGQAGLSAFLAKRQPPWQEPDK